jgi:thioredoxin reductase (NADPH)
MSAYPGRADPEGHPLIDARLFICIGGRPHTDWCPREGVLTDGAGFVLTGTDRLARGAPPDSRPAVRDPLSLETSRPGLVAAGDVRRGSAKRVAGAVGEEAMAAALALRRLAELGVTI